MIDGQIGDHKAKGLTYILFEVMITVMVMIVTNSDRLIMIHYFRRLILLTRLEFSLKIL